MHSKSSFSTVLLLTLMTTAGVTTVQAQRPQSPVVPPPLPPGGPPLNAKVQETLMGPRIQNGRGPVAYVSEDGDHLAILAAKGSRQVMLIDGVEGPVFDEIPLDFWWSGGSRRAGNSAASIWFSPTGGRSAYVGRRAGDFIAVVDGKETVTLMTPASQQSVRTAPTGWTFLFSHDGARLAYAAHDAAAGWVMIVDGVKSPTYRAIDMQQAALIGKRFIYVAQATVDQKWHAVVDGKLSAGYDSVSSLKVTPDGAHYAFIATRRTTGPNPTVSESAVIDGVESPPEKDISDLEQAPDGRVSYMAMRPQTGPGGNPPHLIAGGQDIPWTTTFGTGVVAGPAPQYHVAWSPDGKRFACVKMNNPNPGVTVLVNGKPMGPAYRSANQLAWSPDGAHLAYQAVSESGTFFVLDGEESSGYNWIKEFQWSPDGKRYAYVAGTSTAITMIVDGKEQPKAMGVAGGSLRFSSDGKHFAYGSQTNVAGYQPMVDGVLKPQNLGNFATRMQGNPQVTIPQFFFSADGNHLAYVGQRTDGSGKTPVWVDGVAQQGPASYFHPAWSADGKHFAVLGASGGDPRWAIMVDGKFGPAFEDILMLNEASGRFVTPHTYRYYVMKGAEIHRVTLELGQ